MINEIADTHNQSSELVSVDMLEETMLSLPQVECPVIHHFGPGIYIREVHLSAGTLAVGHAQKFEHLNIMLSGAVAMIGDDGLVKTLRGPMIFTGKPGRKFGFILEDTVWQNVYATDETDIDTLEATYLDKSDAWASSNESSVQAETLRREEDREDFEAMIEQYELSKEMVRAQSENQDDQIEMPCGYGPKITIRSSCIEGKGVFLSAPAEEGEVIGPARINGKRTPLGRYTNHAKSPNAKFEINSAGDIDLVATARISGCEAGGQGEEVTVDYRQALSLSGIAIRGQS